jgi:hypothetical protein
MISATRLPCARSGTRPRRGNPCPSTRVLSASNVVGRTRAEMFNDSVMFWSREQPIDSHLLARDHTRSHAHQTEQFEGSGRRRDVSVIY